MLTLLTLCSLVWLCVIGVASVAGAKALWDIRHDVETLRMYADVRRQRERDAEHY